MINQFFSEISRKQSGKDYPRTFEALKGTLRDEQQALLIYSVENMKKEQQSLYLDQHKKMRRKYNCQSLI